MHIAPRSNNRKMCIFIFSFHHNNGINAMMINVCSGVASSRNMLAMHKIPRIHRTHRENVPFEVAFIPVGSGEEFMSNPSHSRLPNSSTQERASCNTCSALLRHRSDLFEIPTVGQLDAEGKRVRRIPISGLPLRTCNAQGTQETLRTYRKQGSTVGASA